MKKDLAYLIQKKYAFLIKLFKDQRVTLDKAIFKIHLKMKPNWPVKVCNIM